MVVNAFECKKAYEHYDTVKDADTTGIAWVSNPSNKYKVSMRGNAQQRSKPSQTQTNELHLDVIIICYFTTPPFIVSFRLSLRITPATYAILDPFLICDFTAASFLPFFFLLSLHITTPATYAFTCDEDQGYYEHHCQSIKDYWSNNKVLEVLIADQNEFCTNSSIVYCSEIQTPYKVK